MLDIIILAAGDGKRMKSSRPKVLQPVGGRPMLDHLLDAVEGLQPDRSQVVIGAGAEMVRQALAGRAVEFVTQEQRLGTGHAAMQALPKIDPQSRVLILPGDMPLIRTETLQHLLASEADLAVLSFIADDPDGYGRVVRAADGAVSAIVEHKDASREQRAIHEVNSGVMCARAGAWSDWLNRVGADNAQGEYYLTDCIGIATAAGQRVAAVVADDPEQLRGANDREQLAELEQVHQARSRRSIMAQGATLADPSSVHICGSVQCGRDVWIGPGVMLAGNITLGDDVSIGPGCVLTDCDLAAGTRLEPYCVLDGVRTIGACTIGPFARLRPGTELSSGVKIGNFVEIKNARFAPGAKASHLTYVGDAEIGERANLGAGTITCNYDGANKHRTRIGADAFVGSNTALVAPVTIGEGATIGAGSVVTHAAPKGQLTLSRARQKTVEGWQRPRKRDSNV